MDTSDIRKVIPIKVVEVILGHHVVTLDLTLKIISNSCKGQLWFFK